MPGEFHIMRPLVSEIISGNVTATQNALALITTAAGLAVAIPSLVFYNYFVTKADGLVIEMEKASLRMLDILKRD